MISFDDTELMARLGQLFTEEETLALYLAAESAGLIQGSDAMRRLALEQYPRALFFMKVCSREKHPQGDGPG